VIRLASGLLLGAVLLAVPAHAAPADDAGSRLAAMLQTAIASCWNVDPKANIKLPVSFDNVVFTGAMREKGEGLDPKTVPVFPLIERFAKTQPIGSMFEVLMYARMPAADADVWIVYYVDYPGCEIAVANTKSVTATRKALDTSFDGPEWQRAGSKMPETPEAGQAILKQIYVRDIPDPATPRRVVRVVVEGLTAARNGGEDLQFWLSVLDGQRKAAPAEKESK
jgi:hypothetical protein